MRWKLLCLPVVAALLASGVGSLPGDAWGVDYEGYYLFNGEYPSDEETSYSGEGSDNIQGITHDDDNWFISQTLQLWKIPVACDLNNDDDFSHCPGAIHKQLSDYAELAGYNHIGDMSYYEGYVVAAVEAASPQTHAIVLFRADDLSYVGRAELPGLFPACYVDSQTALSMGWVGIDDEGYVYGAGDCVTWGHKYSLNWDQLPGAPVTLTFVEQIDFLDENGAALELLHTQGGVFSESGDLLYMLTGVIAGDCPYGSDVDEGYMEENGGIHVFDTQSWRRVERSTNGTGGHFDYEFHPGLLGGCDEPEGITIWDLDERCGSDPNCAPGIRGQLHAVMLDNDLAPDDDDVTLYSYLNTIHVDGAYSGEETGEPHKPFNTVGEANSLAWDGARISFEQGSYREAVTFSKKIQLLAEDGTVHIGLQGELTLTPDGAVNLSRGGAVKVY